MKKTLLNLKYLVLPISLLVTLFGVVLGGVWVWTGLVLLVTAIVTDTVVSSQATGISHDKNDASLSYPLLLNSFLYIAVPINILLFLVIAWRVHEYVTGVPVQFVEIIGLTLQRGTTGLELNGAMMSVAVWLGLAISIWHEIGHRDGLSFVIARWMMGFVGAAHFPYAHIYDHHLNLGLDKDPATPPRGRNVFTHFILSYYGQSKYLFKFEKDRLTHSGYSYLSFRNSWIRGYLMSVPVLVLFWFAGGWIALAVLLYLWVIPNFELEALNYLEHYGLIREEEKPFEPRHSWCTTTAFSDVLFFGIGRHSDHHARGEIEFWKLKNLGAPNIGKGYLPLFVLTLIPPLWHRYMKQVLAEWDEKYASSGERQIAEKINEEVGYKLNLSERRQDRTYLIEDRPSICQ